MLNKESLSCCVRASSHLEIWTHYFKSHTCFHVNSFSSSVNHENNSLNIWLLEPYSITKLPKSPGTRNIFIVFMEKFMLFPKLLTLFSHGILYLVPSLAKKADIEKSLKQLIGEISEPWFIAHPDSEQTLQSNFNESAVYSHFNQLAKKIAQSDETVCILDEDNAEYGLGFILYEILRSQYLPNLESSTSLHSSPHYDSMTTPRRYVSCKSIDFLNFVAIYPVSKGSIIYINNANPKDYQQHHEFCKKTVLLPKLSDFQNALDFVTAFFADHFIKEDIYLSKKAHALIVRNSSKFQVSDFENLFMKLSSSNIHILTEYMLMLFLEGGKKNIQYDFSHYFSEVLATNAIGWKTGTIYDSGKAFLEKSLIKNALELCNKHKKNTAKILGINRNTLREKYS
jgi:DNA-binding protein Fis